MVVRSSVRGITATLTRVTIATMPARYAEIGDLHHDIDDHVFDLAPLLEWADRDEAEGQEEPPAPEE